LAEELALGPAKYFPPRRVGEMWGACDSRANAYFFCYKIIDSIISEGESMIRRPQPYIRQVPVCINNRYGESPSCGYGGSEEMSENCAK
jgi:hypothetical protein